MGFNSQLFSAIFFVTMIHDSATEVVPERRHHDWQQDTNTERRLQTNSKDNELARGIGSEASLKSDKQETKLTVLAAIEREVKIPNLAKSLHIIDELHEYIDWEKIRDEYIMASLELKNERDSRNLRSGFRVSSARTNQYRPRVPPSVSNRRGPDDDANTLNIDDLIRGDDDIDTRPQGKNDNDDKDSDDGVIIPDYDYGSGKCPNAGSKGVPCADTDLADFCGKKGSFRLCLLACEPSICCIHDAPLDTNDQAPNCNTDENCPQYAPCYIAWWKLQDMVGPATEFQLEQNDDFFDVASNELTDIIADVDFYKQLLFHHFDEIDPILQLTEVVGSLQDVFELPEVWDADSVLSGQPPP